MDTSKNYLPAVASAGRNNQQSRVSGENETQSSARNFNTISCTSNPGLVVVKTDAGMHMPKLPTYVQVPEALGDDACPFLDQYVRFSKKWSPSGYEGFHEACGLWLLSTVAARRVRYELAGPKFTSLYLCLVARTSLYAKSTTASIATTVLQTAGLDWLLAPEVSTPESLIRELSGYIPENYSALPLVEQERIKNTQAFASCRGWYFDEFGSSLAAMMKDGGPMAQFRGLFRTWHDSPDRFVYLTIGRGYEVINNLYLTLLGALTPRDLQPFCRKGSALWGDGFLARFGLVSPPPGTQLRVPFPREQRIVPDELTAKLKAWHEKLGIPQVEIRPTTDTNKKGASLKYICEKGSVEPADHATGEELIEAFEAYGRGLSEIVAKSKTTDLDGNYSRLSNMAVQIAVLLASVEGNVHVGLNHWAKAQAITERWRVGLHNCYQEVNNREPSKEAEKEDRILQTLGKKGKCTARELGQSTGFSSKEVECVLVTLVEQNIVLKYPEGNTTRYAINMGEGGGNID